MRLDAKSFGLSGVFVIVGLLVGQYVHIPLLCIVCNDGNPVGYTLVGKGMLKPGGFDLRICNPSCTLTFNINTNEQKAVTESDCNASNCFHFRDSGDSKALWQLKYTDAYKHDHGPFTDYVDGTVTITP